MSYLDKFLKTEKHLRTFRKEMKHDVAIQHLSKIVEQADAEIGVHKSFIIGLLILVAGLGVLHVI